MCVCDGGGGGPLPTHIAQTTKRPFTPRLGARDFKPQVNSPELTEGVPGPQGRDSWHLGFHPKLNTSEGWLLGFLVSHHEVRSPISQGQGEEHSEYNTHMGFLLRPKSGSPTR